MSVLKSYGERDRKTAPSRTYKLSGSRISGMTDGIEAVKQAIKLALSTERWRHAIYSADYGCELIGLFGHSQRPSEQTVRLMIEETLLEDDRILKIEDFTAAYSGDLLKIAFTAVTSFGNIEIERSESVG